MTLPVKQRKTKVSNRYFNYILVRMGGYIFLHKRTENDIWKNLFELPLIETDRELSEEEFFELSQFRSFFVEGDKPVIKLLQKGVKHVLSHRIIYANFYEVILSENSLSFSSYQKVKIDQIDQYAVSSLIHSFLEKYL